MSPPSDLTAGERELFKEIVNSLPPEHFRPSDQPILVEYITECILARKGADAVRKEGAVVDGKPSPWLAIRHRATRSMCVLSTRLRLNPQARLHAKTVARQVNEPASFYDIMDAAADDDDDAA